MPEQEEVWSKALLDKAEKELAGKNITGILEKDSPMYREMLKKLTETKKAEAIYHFGAEAIANEIARYMSDSLTNIRKSIDEDSEKAIEFNLSGTERVGSPSGEETDESNTFMFPGDINNILEGGGNTIPASKWPGAIAKDIFPEKGKIEKASGAGVAGSFFQAMMLGIPNNSDEASDLIFNARGIAGIPEGSLIRAEVKAYSEKASEFEVGDITINKIRKVTQQNQQIQESVNNAWIRIAGAIKIIDKMATLLLVRTQWRESNRPWTLFTYQTADVFSKLKVDEMIDALFPTEKRPEYGYDPGRAGKNMITVRGNIPGMSKGQMFNIFTLKYSEQKEKNGDLIGSSKIEVKMNIPKLNSKVQKNVLARIYGDRVGFLDDATRAQVWFSAMRNVQSEYHMFNLGERKLFRKVWHR